MHTKDKLAEALRKVGLDKLAEAAAGGYYHDFLSPLDLPELTLVNDLTISAGGPKREEILALRRDVIEGKFDASKEESDEWMQSPEGQEAYRRLVNRD
jgi:hypothetical protein